MQLNFKSISIGLFVLSLFQSGGGNVKDHINTQSQKSRHRKELNSILAQKEEEFSELDTASKIALGRLRSGAIMVVNCSTRKSVVLIEGMKVCLPDGTPVDSGLAATWLLSTGEVNDGRISAVASVNAPDRKEALKILEQRGGFK